MIRDYENVRLHYDSNKDCWYIGKKKLSVNCTVRIANVPERTDRLRNLANISGYYLDLPEEPEDFVVLLTDKDEQYNNDILIGKATLFTYSNGYDSLTIEDLTFKDTGVTKKQFIDSNCVKGVKESKFKDYIFIDKYYSVIFGNTLYIYKYEYQDVINVNEEESYKLFNDFEQELHDKFSINVNDRVNLKLMFDNLLNNKDSRFKIVDKHNATNSCVQPDLTGVDLSNIPNNINYIDLEDINVAELPKQISNTLTFKTINLDTYNKILNCPYYDIVESDKIRMKIIVKAKNDNELFMEEL